jgi:large subunit ribosomal protein L25
VTPAVTEAAQNIEWPSPKLSEPVSWHGKLPERKTPTDVYGLYANRKRMFKGHKWERVRLSKQIRRTILMKDMPRRVRRYKSFYRRRKPNPLKPARSAKAPKLPF